MFSIIIIILIVFLYLFYKYIVKPYYLIQFYTRQKFISFFYPYTGYLKRLKQDLQMNSDMMYLQKTFFNDHPNKYGTVINHRDEVILTIMDHKLKKEFFTNYLNYKKRETSAITYLTLVLGEENIIFSEGDEWKKRRKIISKAFNFDFIKLFPEKVLPITNNVLDVVYKNNKDQYIDILKYFSEITGRSFAYSFFGEDISHIKFENEQLIDAFMKISTELSSQGFGWISFIFGGKIVLKYGLTKKITELNEKSVKLRKIIKIFVEKKYEEYKKGELREGNVLYYMFKENENGENKLEFHEIVNEFSMLLNAGTDTTAHLLLYTLMYLSKNSEILLKLKRELKENIKDIYNYETLQKMPYLNAVLKESLRLRMPLPNLIQREAIKDHFLGDILIKKGTIINVSLLAGGYDSRFYENIESFIPERWINAHINKIEDDGGFVYIPFSAGARNCIGQHVALIEAKCILSKFLNDFKWETQQEWKEKWVLRSLYEPQYPFKIKLIKIKN